MGIVGGSAAIAEKQKRRQRRRFIFSRFSQSYLCDRSRTSSWSEGQECCRSRACFAIHKSFPEGALSSARTFAGASSFPDELCPGVGPPERSEEHTSEL